MVQKRPIIALLTLVLLAMGALWVVWRLFIYDIRQDIDLRGFLDPTNGAMAYTPDAFDATDTLCSFEVPCVQAVDSSTVTLTRFETQEAAEVHAATYGDRGARSGWIAMYFKPGGLNEAERLQFVDGVDGINVSSE